jgi:D-alanyl-D-alanine carboxypeptidase (penicillin-binding protein 5/6)
VTVRWLVAAASAALLLASGAAAAPSVVASHQPLLTTRGSVPAHGLRVTAPAAIVIDAGTGVVLYAKRPHMRRPIASTTKIMTALVAMSRLRPGQLIRVPKRATKVEPFKEGLRAGERVAAWKLYHGLLLVSGNDTAETLAAGAGGTRANFLRLMNKRARMLGLNHTHFTSPSGLVDAGNYSTVWDLAALARYAMWNPLFRKVVGTKEKRVAWKPPTYAKLYENHNQLLWRYRGADGIKTGWTTAAGRCLVASAHRHGIHLISVVLGAKELYGDTRRLLDYGFRSRG